MNISQMNPLLSLPTSADPALKQLTRDATPEELIQAAALNHIHWFSENAMVAVGEVKHDQGLTSIYSPSLRPEGAGEIILAFPQLGSATGRNAIDAVLHTARQTNVRQLSCWSLLPTEPEDLAALLVARGFQWGWQPHWMALDLAKMPPVDFFLPDNLEIRLDDESEWEVNDLPYYDGTEAARLQDHARQTPRQTFHFGAWLNGQIVGHSLIHLSPGPLGVAGMYAVGVVPDARSQGIGRAISLAACQYARALGCRYVLLNAATHIYERLGFVSLGNGQTWWMFRPALDAPLPSHGLIAFTEAIGRGDINALSTLPPDAQPANLDAPLLCKMTPLEVAARLRQPVSAEWLLVRGASPNVIPLCDLGWRDRLPALLAAQPALANRRLGEWGITPLHEAVSRNDIDLVRLLLTTQPDLSLEDTNFHATALGWARHFGHREIISLLEAAS